MTEHVTLTKEELNQIIDSALSRSKHNEPSKQTMEMFDKLNHAIFGDAENIGMLKKTDQMYEVFVVGKSGTTLIKWIGAIIIAFLGIVSAIKGITK